MTQSNLLSPEKITEAPQEKMAKTFRVAVIMLAAAFSVEAFYLFLAFQMGAWQMYALAGVIAFFCILNIIALPVIRRGHLEAGSWLMVAGMLLIFPAASALIADIGFIFGGALFLLTTLVASQTLPANQARIAIIASVAFGFLATILDYLGLDYRLFVPEIQVFIPVITVVLLIVFGYFVVRQVWGGSMRNKLLVGFIVVTLIATGALSVYLFISTNNILRQNLERELTTHTNNVATRIGKLLTEQINILTTLSLNEALQQSVETSNLAYPSDAAEIRAELNAKDAQWQAADAANNNKDALVQEHLTNVVALDLLEYQQTFPNNIEVFVTDKYGGLAGATNRTSDYYQADEDWWQAAYNNGQGAVYIGEPEYDESSNALAVLIVLPIRSRVTGEVIGILRTTYLASALNTILGEKIGETGQADLFIPGEVVSYFHEGQLDVVDPGEYANLQAVADQGMAEINYQDTFSVVIQTPVKTEEGNQAVDELGWIIAFHQHEDEAFLPLNAQIRGAFLVIAIVTVFVVLGAIGLSLYLVRPIVQLTQSAEEIAAGNLDSRASVTSTDEIGILASTFNSMTSQLQEILRVLEQRVADRTRGLELAAEVGRSVSRVRALDEMLRDAAEIIRAQFDLYYVQVYLLDAGQANLVLQSGTGAVGEQLVNRGHRLTMNTASINGRAAIEKRSIVVSDTAASPTFRPNPLLPDTRSEMAIPLLLGDRVVGVLDLQSAHANALSNDSLPAFEALAGQLAVAVQNASLLEQAQEARAEVEAQARRLVRSNWQEHLDALHRPEQTGFVFERNQVKVLEAAAEPPTGNQEDSLAAPISVTGQPIGSLVVEVDETRQTPQTIELVNIVARQVAQQIENLRLLESAERYRFEAEESARRLTREGWQEYFSAKANQSLSYLYDLQEVRASDQGALPEDSALAIPIKVRDETIGKLAVFGLESADAETMELINTVSDRLSEHIEGLRLLEETQLGQLELNRRAEQLAAVSEISTISSRELDVQKMLATVVHLTQRRFGLYHAHIFTYNDAAKMLEIVACGWQEGDEHEGTHGTTVIPIDQEQSLVARAARTRTPIVVNDVRSDPGWLPNPLLPDTASELAVPLVIGDDILGVLDVQSERLNAFSDEDVSIQATLAAQVATALQNARSFARAQRQAERESMLNAISQKIQSATSVEAVLQIAARELGHALGAPRTIAQLSMKDNK